MNIFTPFVVLSAERAEYDAAVNVARSHDLGRQLESRGLDFNPVRGSYLGIEEAGYLVLLDAGDASPEFDILVRLAQRYDQHSLLSVDANRVATFHYLGVFPSVPAISKSERVGLWAHVTAEHAGELDGWTRDSRGYHYAIIGAQARTE